MGLEPLELDQRVLENPEVQPDDDTQGLLTNADDLLMDFIFDQ